MALLAVDTKNSKIVGTPRRGFAAALSLPIKQTCPDTCSLKGKGCYAQGGRQAIHVRRLEGQHAGRTALQVSRLAAAEITAATAQGLNRGRALRLFVSGDARTAAAADVIARAARTWIRTGGSAAWGYTHAWRSVPSEVWRGVSILASVESDADAREARGRGYVPAKVVDSHPANGRAYKGADGSTWIPCPEQSRGVPCVACGLCFDVEGLRARNAGITFAVHGQSSKTLKRRLPMLQSHTKESKVAS